MTCFEEFFIADSQQYYVLTLLIPTDCLHDTGSDAFTVRGKCMLVACMLATKTSLMRQMLMRYM